MAPFAGVTISDGNADATDTLTISLTGAGGALSGMGLSANSDGTYTLAAASPDTLTAEIDALSFTPSPAAPGQPSTTAFILTDRSSAGPTATDSITTIVDTPASRQTASSAPVIAGTHAGQATTAEAAVTPFSGATISDGNTGATDTLTIALTGTGGILSGTGLTASADGTYTLAAATSDILTSELDALAFASLAGTPGQPSTTAFVLTDRSSAGTTATDSITTVVDTATATSSKPIDHPTANMLPDSGSTTDLSGTSGLTIGDYGDSRNDETILWSSTGGSDTVQLHDVNAAQRSTLNLGDLAQADVTLTRVNNDLQVIDKATGAVLTVSGQSANNNMGVASIAFSDGTVLAGSGLSSAAPIVAVPGQKVVAPSDVTVRFGPQDGGEITGNGTDQGVTVVWGADSGDAVGQWWGDGNKAEGSDPSTVVLAGLDPSDVTLSRTVDDRWTGQPYDNLTITSSPTAPCSTMTRSRRQPRSTSWLVSTTRPSAPQPAMPCLPQEPGTMSSLPVMATIRLSMPRTTAISRSMLNIRPVGETTPTPYALLT